MVGLREVNGLRDIIAPLVRQPTGPIVHGVLTLGLGLLIAFWLWGTSAGLIYRAICENRIAAKFYNMSVNRFDVGSAVAGGLMAGICGFLYISSRAIAPYQMLSIAVWAIAGSIIGGPKSPIFSLLGGVVLGFIEVYSLQHLSAGLKDIIIGGTMVVLILFRPQGLLFSMIRAA